MELGVAKADMTFRDFKKILSPSETCNVNIALNF
jgi:hypothetical protein